MAQENELSEKLFSYGTLQRTVVQQSTFGRLLDGKSDGLPRYRITLISIEDPEVVASTGDTHYKNVEHSGVDTDVVEGTVFSVTLSELELADQYEDEANYYRVIVELESGIRAWVYLNSSKR
jgi:hypothetical protein